MQEFLLKVGDTINPNPDLDKACCKDGDILYAPKQWEAKRMWDDMLANGKVCQLEYDRAQTTLGVFKFPWGKRDIKDHFVLVSNDSFTDEEIDSYSKQEWEETGGTDPDTGEPELEVTARTNFKIDIENMEYFSDTEQKNKKLSVDSINDIRDKDITVLPRYDKPIAKSFIEDKSK